MKNIFLITFGLFLATSSQRALSAAELLPSPHHDVGHGGWKMVDSDKDYEDKVFSILDGKSYFDEADDYLGKLSKENMVRSIGTGFLAEFYRLLGDFYSSKHLFDKAGESYHRALHLLEEPDQNLRKFLSTIGVTRESTAGDIKGALEVRAAHRIKR